MRPYAILDLETTGFDAVKESILEIAIVVIQDGRVIEEFSSLTRPERPIPPEVTDLTGITPAMVEKAPPLSSLRSKIQKILGDHLIVGHNVAFDLAFLHAQDLALFNPTLDTVTLATVLLPRAGRYGLEYLADFLQLPLEGGKQKHRALSDVYLTGELLLELQRRAVQLDLAILAEIVEAGRRVNWPETTFFEEALKEATRTAFASGRRPGQLKELYQPEKLEGKQLTPKEVPDVLPIKEIMGMFGPEGNFARAFKGFEARPQQLDMVKAVAEAFNKGQKLLIEAGTGTGKSVGYLIPAVFWAVQNGRRVVISTNTINLQDQLVQKDIPELQRILPLEFRASVRKGRSNYICTRLVQQWRHKGPNTPEEMALYARLLVWLPTTQTGDKAEISLRSFDERLQWDKLSADNDVCTSDQCSEARCPRYILQRRAENAHIVIVNHSLLLSDVANNNHILPEFRDLIIDEAHHLEAAVTDGLSFEADRKILERLLMEIIRSRSGLLDTITGQTNVIPAGERGRFDEVVNKIRQSTELALNRLEELFDIITFFVKQQKISPSDFAQQIRLTPAVRGHEFFDDVQQNWDNLHKPLMEIGKNLVRLLEGLGELIEHYEVADIELLVQMLTTSIKGLEETRANLDNIIARPREDFIYWLEVYRDKISLHAAPLHVGPLVQEHIFHNKETVIMTSATMRTAPAFGQSEPTFTYIRQRLQAEEVQEVALGSPFDYKANTLLYLVTDMPEPQQPGYQRYVEQAIINTAVTLGGRTLVLFTSYRQLYDTYIAIRDPLRREEITVLAQLEGASRQQLTDQFKGNNTRTVLLGTKSFWEGVDIPGEALQAVILTKIPFDVPSDPIFAARSETFDNAFYEYSIPEAILRWRQGFGRLIRRKSDEGVVLILDKRVMSKGYGRAFTDSLPDCTVIRQPSNRIAELLVRWFKRQR